jgi:hypothetical protein
MNCFFLAVPLFGSTYTEQEMNDTACFNIDEIDSKVFTPEWHHKPSKCNIVIIKVLTCALFHLVLLQTLMLLMSR